MTPRWAAAAGGFNVGDLAGSLLATGVDAEHRFDVAEDLARRGLGKANRDEMKSLMTALQERGVDLDDAKPAIGLAEDTMRRRPGCVAMGRQTIMPGFS